LTYTVDSDSTKDGGGDSSAVLWIFLGAHERVVVCLEESTDDGEDDNGKDGDDNASRWSARRREQRSRSRSRSMLRGVPCPGIEGGNDGLHGGLRRAAVVGGNALSEVWFGG